MIVSGRTIVTEVGKAAPLSIDTIIVKRITIYAIAGQSGTIAVGDKNVSQISSNESGAPLLAEDYVPFENEDLSMIFIDSSVVNEGVRWIVVV